MLTAVETIVQPACRWFAKNAEYTCENIPAEGESLQPERKSNIDSDISEKQLCHLAGKSMLTKVVHVSLVSPSLHC